MKTTENGSTMELTAEPITVLCRQCQCKITAVLSLDNHHVAWKGSDISATRAEFRVLRLLYANAGRFMTYREIYDVVQSPGFIAGEGGYGMFTNVRSVIKRVRQKFVQVGADQGVIENMVGVGYRWKGDA